MAIDLATFKARYPEFVTLAISDVTLQLYLDDAYAHLSDDAWGDCYERAVFSYAAHLTALSARRTQAVSSSGLGATAGASGPVTSSGADGLSVSFGSGLMPRTYSEAWYQLTSYGQDYLALRDECLAAAGISSCQ